MWESWDVNDSRVKKQKVYVHNYPFSQLIQNQRPVKNHLQHISSLKTFSNEQKAYFTICKDGNNYTESMIGMEWQWQLKSKVELMATRTMDHILFEQSEGQMKDRTETDNVCELEKEENILLEGLNSFTKLIILELFFSFNCNNRLFLPL